MDSREIRQETKEQLPQVSNKAECAECAETRPQEVRILEQPSDQTHDDGGAITVEPPPTSTSINESDRSWFTTIADVLQNRNKGLQSELDELRKGSKKKDLEIAQLRQKLSERDRELGEMKNTLCMYDDCSEFDIVSMMNAINARIQSLARNTAQRWLWGTSKAPEVAGNRHTLTETEMEICRRAFGRQLVRALGSPPPEQSDSAEVLLPLAWQACIVAVVSKILSSFVAGLPTSADGITIDNALRAVSESVKKGEIQPAYGRWRFVTHRYMKTLIPNRNPLQSSVDEALTNCYLAARLALKSSCPDYQAFVDAFRGPVTEIMEEAAKLRTNIQEKMLTANYEPYLPAPAVSFKAESMEVDLKVDRVFLRDTVVCTTRLGLGSSRKKERENSQVLLRENFLKAQVLTERNLREILTGK